jgi:hypothetical protein
VWEAEESEMEAVRISRGKDPQIEEMAKWFLSVFKLRLIIHGVYFRSF